MKLFVSLFAGSCQKDVKKLLNFIFLKKNCFLILETFFSFFVRISWCCFLRLVVWVWLRKYWMIFTFQRKYVLWCFISCFYDLHRIYLYLFLKPLCLHFLGFLKNKIKNDFLHNNLLWILILDKNKFRHVLCQVVQIITFSHVFAKKANCFTIFEFCEENSEGFIFKFLGKHIFSLKMVLFPSDNS